MDTSSTLNPDTGPNFSSTSMEKEFPFDLNTYPMINENASRESHHILPNEQPNLEEEEEIPIMIRSSSNGRLSLDLNVQPNPDFQYPLLDLNAEILNDEDDSLQAETENFPHSDPFDTNDQEEPRVENSKKNLTNEQRKAIYSALLERSANGKLKRYTTREVSSLFSVSIQKVQRIWKRARETQNAMEVDVSHKRTRNCGRKRIQIDLASMMDIPCNRRTTLRSLGEALHVNYVTLFRRLNQGLIRRHSNAIKPHLKEENKRARLQFCMSMLDQNSLPHEPKFACMHNIVHIDEKWFYMTKKMEHYYLLPTEEEPLRTCQSKNFIGKVMFLVAMSRPRFDNQGEELFSGKIGVFPFVTKEPAQRRSKNRDAGTLETKPITTVKRETVKAYLLEKVIPAIQIKWPIEDSRNTIFIQQDNARTHVDPSDEEFRMVASQNGFDIRLMCQPPNSPDLNILDLGFFSAIQSLQHKECPKTVDELICAVERAFDEYPTRKVNRIFLTLQSCMQEIMKAGGSNKYKIPHLHKASLEREGHLPTQLDCDSTLVTNVMSMLAT